MTRIFIALTLALVMTSTCTASIVHIRDANHSNSTNIGSYTASLSHIKVSDDVATLIVNIRNDTDTLPGGKITALAFNNPFNRIVGVSAFRRTGNLNFNSIGGATYQNTVDVDPFGDMDIGASISSQFAGGGSPNDGIAIGQSATFEWDVTGTDVGNLSAMDFVNELSENTTDDKKAFFLVRFRGFDNGGSDKSVGGEFDPNGGSSVPEPSAVAVWSLLSCLGLGVALKRRRAAKAS